MGKKDRIEQVLLRVAKRYIVEEAGAASREEVIAFLKRAYSDQFNAKEYEDEQNIKKRWEWANKLNPNMPEGMFPAWISRDRESRKIVGHFAVIPVHIKLKQSLYPAVWGRDLVVLPEVRKLGIGPFLVESVLKAIKDRASIFIIAGLNEDVYTIYKKFDFTDLGLIPLYVRVKSVRRLIEKKIKNTAFSALLKSISSLVLKIFYLFPDILSFKYRKDTDISVEEITKFDSSFNVLWNESASAIGALVVRDSAFLNWRFIDQPYWKYRIFKAIDRKSNKTKGCVVLRKGVSKGLNTGVISELFASPVEKKVIKRLIRFATEHFTKDPEIDLIRCNMLGKVFEECLKGQGFIRIKSTSHLMFTNVRDDIDHAFISKPENWFINYADSDLDFF